MNINDLYVDKFCKIVWQTENDKLYRREYVFDRYNSSSMYDIQVGSIDKNMWKSSESEFTLNDDGTRPVKKTMRSYDEAGEVMSENTQTYTWDNLGRLIASSGIPYKSGESYYNGEYTYADDYAKKLSLREAIEALDGGGQIYPEDEFLQFGRIATSSFWYSDEDCRENKYEWNTNGQLIGGTWTETYTMDGPDQIDRGEIRVGYNADVHMAWKIGHNITESNFYDFSNAEYSKTEYLYNKEGVWTGETYYTGDSWDGPWLKVGEWGNSRARKRLATRAATTPKFIDDMTDGYHSIENHDGVWDTYGNYRVSDGVVTYGRYEQTLASNASVPANPEYNYTDPLMPLEGEDDECDIAMHEAWCYKWNTDKGDWELREHPTEAKRVYNKDGNIVADIYDGNQTIVSTITYHLDDNDRLIEEIYSKGGNITYEYLPGTNYLLESVETAADNSRNVCHYYYSKHNYVEPTGIESIKRNDASTSVWYDLQGRRITTPTSKGIYIVNGKKVVVR